jgi:ABC-type polysaccharide/polyol phosphate transport system ATPase subunit
MLMGIEKKEITRKLPSIIKFADIGNFIDASLFTYSSGMKLRLGFATAAFTDPSIIVIDENISVGDYGFRQKIWKWINNFIKSGNTVILATHEEDLINTFCNRIIELKNGIVVHSGKNFSKVKKTLKNKKNKGNK